MAFNMPGQVPFSHYPSLLFWAQKNELSGAHFPSQPKPMPSAEPWEEGVLSGRPGGWVLACTRTGMLSILQAVYLAEFLHTWLKLCHVFSGGCFWGCQEVQKLVGRTLDEWGGWRGKSFVWQSLLRPTQSPTKSPRSCHQKFWNLSKVLREVRRY